MLRQAGVIRVENVHQLFDVAQLVIHQPLPAGQRVAVVGNSDALGALTAQAALSWDLEISHGPVSLPSDATADQFAAALRAAFEDPEVDSVLTCFIPPLETVDDGGGGRRARRLPRQRQDLRRRRFLGMSGVHEALEVETSGDAYRRVVPAYAMPEDAVRALAAATRYSEWRTKDRGDPVDPVDINRAAAVDLVEQVLADAPEGRALTRAETRSLLAAYGITVWESRLVDSADEAVAAADALGYPVILKTTSPVLRHQPGLSGVRARPGRPRRGPYRHGVDALAARTRSPRGRSSSRRWPLPA